MNTTTGIQGFSVWRRWLELALALVLAGGLGLLVVLLGGLDAKYQLAAMLGGVGFCALLLFPERRLLCVLLWVCIMPLSIEKVFYVNAIYDGFMPQAIVINVGDVILLLLSLFLMAEAMFSHNKVWYWPRVATYFSLYLLWAAVSALMHGVFLDTGHTGSTPWTLLHYVRVLWFIVLLHSAIRTRAELIAVLMAMGLVLFGEAVLVGLSYVTGELYNFAKLTGATPILELQSFSSNSGDKMVRGVGTLGHTNQQAAFHTLYTLPLVALLVGRNNWIRAAALVVFCASAFAVVLSFSRSAWLSFALATCVVFFIAWRRGEIAPVAWLTGALGTVVMIVALGALAEPIYQRVAYGDDGATDSRIRMIDLALDLFAEHPVIGVGPGEFSEASLLSYPLGFKENEWVPLGSKPMVPTVGRLEVVRLVQPGKETLTTPLPVHNKYFLTLSELGVVGLILWASMYLHLLREAWRCGQAKDRVLRYLGIGCLGSVVASTSYMMLDLFSDDKSMQVLLFVPVLMTAAARVARTLQETPKISTEKLSPC